MFNFSSAIRSVPVNLPLAVVACLALSLGSACSSPGSRPFSSLPEQSAGAPLEEPDEQGNGDPAEPLQAMENSPSGAGFLEPWELHRAAAAGDVARVKQLVDEHPGRINDQDPRSGFTALHEAARRGHAGVVQVLMAAGAEPKLRNKDDMTALGVARQEGHLEIVEIFTDADFAEPLQTMENSPSESRELHRAAAAGDVESVKRLIDENPDEINSKDSHSGLAPLHEAARAGHADVAQVLIAAGADPNDTTTHGNQTPLHLAAKVGAEEVCKILLEAGAKPWLEDEDGATAIEVAIQKDNVELVKLFVDANVDLSIRALDLAASNNNIEIMKVLLELRSGRYLDSALHLAAYNGHTEMAKLLVQAGAYVMTENFDHKKTPIDLAYEQGHVNLAQMLERTPELLEAVTAGDVGTVEQLIDEEQSVNVRHPLDGYTPLHEAVRMGHTDVVQVLLDAGADVYLRDKNYASALDIALEKGYIEIAKILSNAGGYINIHHIGHVFESAVSNRNIELVKFLTEKNLLGYELINNSNHDSRDVMNEKSLTPLHVAAANGYTEIAKLLVQAGAYVMAQNNDNKTPIDLAYEQGHVSLAQMLEKTLKLREAAVTGNVEKVKELLAAGVLTGAKDPTGATVLYRVIEAYLEPPYSSASYPATEGHIDIIRALIEAGAKVDSFTRWGRMHEDLNFSSATPLHVAAVAGHPEIVRLLIEAGKDINGYINFRNHRNYHNALSLGLEENPNQEVAKLLIQAGADVNAFNFFNRTPLHTVAAMHEDVTMSVNIATALINAGANLNPKTSRSNSLSFHVGYTPLHTAASVNHIEMVKLLIKHGANINSKDESDNSPLHLAIYNGHGKLAKLLIESGAYIHSRNYNGNTPIQMAAHAGLPGVIQQLIEAGSPVNVQDQVGDTPLHDAALQGQVEAAQVLLEAGADVNATNNAGKTPLHLAEQQGHGSLAETLKAAGGQRGG